MSNTPEMAAARLSERSLVELQSLVVAGDLETARALWAGRWPSLRLLGFGPSGWAAPVAGMWLTDGSLRVRARLPEARDAEWKLGRVLTLQDFELEKDDKGVKMNVKAFTTEEPLFPQLARTLEASSAVQAIQLSEPCKPDTAASEARTSDAPAPKRPLDRSLISIEEIGEHTKDGVVMARLTQKDELREFGSEGRMRGALVLQDASGAIRATWWGAPADTYNALRVGSVYRWSGWRSKPKRPEFNSLKHPCELHLGDAAVAEPCADADLPATPPPYMVLREAFKANENRHLHRVQGAVLQLGTPRDITMRSGEKKRVTECWLVDESGIAMPFKLWEEQEHLLQYVKHSFKPAMEDGKLVRGVSFMRVSGVSRSVWNERPELGLARGGTIEVWTLDEARGRPDLAPTVNYVTRCIEANGDGHAWARPILKVYNGPKPTDQLRPLLEIRNLGTSRYAEDETARAVGEWARVEASVLGAAPYTYPGCHNCHRRWDGEGACPSQCRGARTEPHFKVQVSVTDATDRADLTIWDRQGLMVFGVSATDFGSDGEPEAWRKMQGNHYHVRLAYAPRKRTTGGGDEELVWEWRLYEWVPIPDATPNENKST